MIADAPEMIAAMQAMGRPSSHEARARFSQLNPGKRLAITTLIDFIPQVQPYESTILVEFFPSGEIVRMVVTLQPMHNEELTRMSLMGFTSQISKLDGRFGVVASSNRSNSQTQNSVP
jgi:hypothetical protein